MIKFENVNYIVTDGKKKKIIINDMSFTLPNTGLVGLLGRSGSGKTTVLNLISKTVTKTSGKIYFEQLDYDFISNYEEDYIRSNYMSYISQDIKLFDNLTVKDNLLILYKISKKKNEDEILEKYINLLNLQDLLEEYVYNLSGGERQRVEILRSLLNGSKVFLVDEPTSSLDEENAKIVVNTLKEISKNALVIVSTHDLYLFNNLFDYTLYIEYGKIKEDVYAIDDIQNIDFSIHKLTIKDDFFIEKKIFKKQNIRRVFSVIMLFISMFLCLLFLVLTCFDLHDYQTNAFEKLDYKCAVVSNYDYSNLTRNTVTNNDLREIISNYDTFYYDVKIWPLSSFNSKLSEYKYVFNNIVVNNDLNDNEIIITDYSAEILINNNIVNCKDIKDLVGINVDIYGRTYKIIGIETTNYNWYKTLNSDSKLYYEQFVDLWYLNIYMNQYTVNNINSNFYKLVNRRDGVYSVYKDKNLLDYTLIVGSDDLGLNEVMLNPRSIVGLLREEYDDANKELYIGRTFKLKNKDYIIKGIFAGGNELEILVNEETYKSIESNDNAFKNEYVMVDLSTLSNNNLKELERLEYNLISPYMEDLEFCAEDFTTFKKYSKYLLVITLVLFITMGSFLIINNFKNNRKSIVILRSLGCPLKDVNKIFIIDLFKILILSFMISLVLYTGLFIYLNCFYINNTCLNIWLKNYDFLSLFILICITVISFVSVSLVNLILINRKDINNIEKN